MHIINCKAGNSKLHNANHSQAVQCETVLFQTAQRNTTYMQHYETQYSEILRDDCDSAEQKTQCLLTLIQTVHYNTRQS